MVQMKQMDREKSFLWVELVNSHLTKVIMFDERSQIYIDFKGSFNF